MCALVLSEAGYKPLFDRAGDDVDTRKSKSGGFLEKRYTLIHAQTCSSARGGAGTFSDGKLNTGHKKMSDADLFWSSLCVSVRRGDPI